ncbi:hypothetical protein [Paraclostridium bifermentans]|uniref:hypothetical protein n=1 Tax=Paraclostridium bifermentans TaxID=1490 RepID=UPI00280C64A5|nr:hypothetical protein ANS014_02640 [Paraclostridium bifermentans]
MKNNEEVLNLVFKKSENIEYEVSSDGIVTILEKQDHKVQNFFRKLKFKIPMYKKMELDEYGSFIFLQIDGKKKCRRIRNKITRKVWRKITPSV